MQEQKRKEKELNSQHMFIFPSRNTLRFENIIFDSNFCSGNMKCV